MHPVHRAFFHPGGEAFHLQAGRVLQQQSLKFTKSDRLRKRNAFLLLSKKGKKMHSPYFFALFSPNDLSRPRVGITASGKVGGAVVRNRIKRLVREFFRTHAKNFGLGNLDMNIIAKKGAGEQPSDAVFSSLNDLFEKIAVKSRN